jgi:hypothetical protein
MYRTIVRRQYRKAWQAMNRHDYEAIIAQLAPTFEVTFVGDTSLGGSRHQLGRSAPASRSLVRIQPVIPTERRLY